MSEADHHCPFLNRSDTRCSKNFSLDRLNQTYNLCFGHYTACSVYLELLVERRVRRLTESVRPGHVEWPSQGVHAPRFSTPLVQLTLRGRQAGVA